jgi:predicted dehydrogenase
MKNYRWGILGAGRIAEKFCTALNFTTGAEVYAIASRNLANAKNYADTFGATVYYDTYEELMKDANIDIIYIATPHAFHYQHTMACIQHKKAVLCEKPMALTHEQAIEMIAAANANHIFLMEGMWTACMPFMEKIKSLLTENSIGQPQFIAADFGFTTPVDFTARLYNHALGGGSMMDIGIYPLFLATSLFGIPSVIKSVSKLASSGVDEYVNVVLQYPGGETAHLLSSISFNTAIVAEIIGTKGKITINNPWFKATDFTLHLNDGTKTNFSIPHECNGFEHEIKEVMHCLDRGLLESEKVPHQLTLSMSKIMQHILQQAGVSYSKNYSK